MSSSLKWIRRNYNVPAFRGVQITYQGKPAVILGGRAQYLRMRVQGERHPVTSHPTYAITYPALPLPPRPRGWCGFCLEERSLAGDGTVGRHQRPGADRFPIAERLCPGTYDKPWGVCAWTVPAPAAPAAPELESVAA